MKIKYDTYGSFFVINMNPLSHIPTQYPNRANTPADSGTCCTPCMCTSTWTDR